MRHIIITICCTTLGMFSCNQKRTSPYKSDLNEPGYEKNTVLQVFINTIKALDSLSKYAVNEKGELVNFFVYDLVDTNNFQNAINAAGNNNKPIYFNDKHLYHFSSSIFDQSFSNVAYLANGGIRIFQAVNCRGSKDNIDSVISFISTKYSGPIKDTLTSRLRRIRKFGRYSGYDNYSLKLDCKCDPCE